MENTITTIAEGYNPATEESFTNLLSLQELENVLTQLIDEKDVYDYIQQHYTKTVIDGLVVYYVE